VGPHIDAALLASLEHAAQVGVDDVKVQQQLRRIEGVLRLADKG
jgi:hypothetical protein